MTVGCDNHQRIKGIMRYEHIQHGSGLDVSHRRHERSGPVHAVGSFNEPLARMWRDEPTKTRSGYGPSSLTPTPASRSVAPTDSPLSVNRRRGLNYTTVTETEHGLRFDNTDLGITAYIEPINTTTNRHHAERSSPGTPTHWPSFPKRP